MFKELAFVAGISLVTIGSAQTFYSTGFDGGFANGQLSGQNGWAGTGTPSANAFAVTSSRSFSLSNSVQISQGSTDWAEIGGGNYAAPSSGDLYTTAHLYIDPTTATGRVFGLKVQNGSGATPMYGVTVSGDGTVRIGKNDWLFNSGTLTTNSALVGRWISLSLDHVIASGVVHVLIESTDNSFANITGDITGLSTSTFENNSDLYSNYGSGSATGSAFFDDYRVASTPVPEPATLGFLSFGALAAMRRRRVR